MNRLTKGQEGEEVWKERDREASELPDEVF
jgi:hypothetical protein